MPNKLYHTDKIGFDIETTYQVFYFLLVRLYYVLFVVLQLLRRMSEKIIGNFTQSCIYITYIF